MGQELNWLESWNIKIKNKKFSWYVYADNIVFYKLQVVDATVSRIQQTCIFGDDKRFLRRLAYVETLDGTDTAAFNGGRNGGIWKIMGKLIHICKW